eukprot:jgi/Chrpa1/11080/Chrysochromulina_OHIO_Genome00011574-RA
MPDGDWTPGFVKRFEERLEPKPIQKCLFLVVIFVIPVAIIALVPTLIDALVSSKNLFLFVGYSALRRVTQWLSDLFTFFYYVNQGRIADLEGAKKFATAGGFVVLASIASIGMGLLMMALCMICASPLLRFLAPYEPELVDQTAYWALIIAAAWLPGQIFLSSGSGVLLAQRQIVRLYVLVLFWVLLATVLLLLITLNNTCDQQLEEANRTIPDLDTERWVCPDARHFLNMTSVVLATTNAGLLFTLLWLMVRSSRARGYFVEHGFDVRHYWADVDLRSGFTRDHAAIAVRSFFNNTKEIVTFVCAVRIGVLEAAVFSMFDSLGTFAYGVPNILATPAMFYGSNLYGQGRYRDFSRLLLFYAAMARDEFVEVSKPVLTMALVLQPLKAMVAVYGPLIIAVQRYVAFGALVFVIFWCAFVPMTAVGAATGNLNTLIAAHVVYHALLLAGLIFVVHVQEIPRLRAKSKDGNAPGTSAAVVPVSSKLGGVKGSVSEA